MSTSSINTILVSHDATSAKLLKEVLASSDYNIIFEGKNLTQQLNASWLIEPDIIIVTMETADYDVLMQLKVITDLYPIPTVVFTQHDIEQGIEHAIDAGVNAYVVDGLKKNRVLPILKTACLRFNKQQQIKKEVNELRTTLAERKLIEKAKGLVMAERQCTEDEAYRLLRSTAMRQNMRMSALAKNVIEAVSLIHT